MRAWQFLHVCAGVALTVAPASAQTSRIDSLPVPLVEALVQPYGGNTAHEFYVGRVPPTLDQFLFVPRNARVLGGMVTFSGAIAVLDVPASAEDVTTMYQREMPKLGWTASSGAARSWGFVPAAGQNSAGNGLEFCHIGQSIQIIPAPNRSGGTLVTANVQSYGQVCAFTRPGAPNGLTNAAPMPTLTNPIGSLMNTAECSPQPYFPSGSNGSAERIQTNLSPEKLLDYFGKQLADSAWGAPKNSSSARRVWTRAQSADTREVTVTVNSLPGTKCFDVSMQVRTLVGPPR